MASSKTRIFNARLQALAWKQRAFAVPWTGQSLGEPGAPQNYKALALTDDGALTSINLSYDIGHHNSGWFKNSQYERCLHASLAMLDRATGRPATPTEAEIAAWAGVIFGDDRTKLWRESGKTSPVFVHLRLFYDEHGQPVVPQGEVYNLVPWADGSSPEKIYR